MTLTSTPSRPALSDGPPLPEMREAVLSREEIQALVADLQAHTQILGSQYKAASQQQTPPHNLPLESAIDQLLSRTVMAVQVRYRFDGHEWTDTLINSPAGVRLVRCQHTPVAVSK